jgi:hypothetical protein
LHFLTLMMQNVERHITKAKPVNALADFGHRQRTACVRATTSAT